MTIGTTGCSAPSSSQLRFTTGGRGICVDFLSCCFIISLTACAPLTEQEKYSREDSLNIAKEEFQRREEQCGRMGGAMQMQSTPLGKFGRQDYKTARCVRL